MLVMEVGELLDIHTKSLPSLYNFMSEGISISMPNIRLIVSSILGLCLSFSVATMTPISCLVSKSVMTLDVVMSLRSCETEGEPTYITI